MADDLVTMIRRHLDLYDDYEADDDQLLTDAADKIERLRAAGETLAKAVATYFGDEAWADRALAVWEEARRG